MPYEDRKLICRDCQKEFVWSAGEQSFFETKGFGAPSRCTECRKKNKMQRNSPAATATVSNSVHEITCSVCGKVSEVPFKPRNPQGVLCADCFAKQNPVSAA
jgi:CxxC-x17-CxxC domain-containing protein